MIGFKLVRLEKSMAEYQKNMLSELFKRTDKNMLTLVPDCRRPFLLLNECLLVVDFSLAFALPENVDEAVESRAENERGGENEDDVEQGAVDLHR